MEDEGKLSVEITIKANITRDMPGLGRDEVLWWHPWKGEWTKETVDEGIISEIQATDNHGNVWDLGWRPKEGSCWRREEQLDTLCPEHYGRADIGVGLLMSMSDHLRA